MNPQEQNPAGPKEMRNPLEAMQPGEQTLFEIKRHPIGLLGIYVAAGFILIVVAIVLFGLIPHVASDQNKGHIMGIAAVGYAILMLITLGFVFISNKVYWGNSWILTSDSITQVRQTSLFDKQSSQLSLNNLEDVTAEQNGVLAHMFNYGVIRAETAGERSKFMFLYCPNPNLYAKKVLEAREQFEQAGRYQASHYQAGQVTPGSAQFPAQPTANPANDPGVNINTEQ